MNKKREVKQQLSKYQPQEIEKKWQKKWEEEKTYQFQQDLPASRQVLAKKKYYNLVELPYPSGDLHLGHWFTFVLPDVHARFKKMQGYNVFFPNGFDAFGLPAENAAIKRNIHPQEWTFSNIETMRKQFGTMGTMIDWSHEAITCLPEYYRWNQWIFLKMLEKGLAYRGKTLSNWCPSCQTVLANENIEAGKCWRCGTEVVQKEIEQWFIKITEYADRLIWPSSVETMAGKPEDSNIEWPQSVKVGQNNWIGRKEGMEIDFKVVEADETITVFTTTPINYGATFLVVAPEHDFVNKIINKKVQVPENIYKDVKAYVAKAIKNSERERLVDGSREKTGVFTGFSVNNHVTNEKIPVWISDFVLNNYGTGAIQGCPGHDARDFEFAKKFGLPVQRVVVGPHGETGEIEKAEQLIAGESKGKMMNSGFLNGMEFIPAMERTKDFFEEKGWGRRVVTYHIHDWSISRQRYWGTPVPVMYCANCRKLKTQNKKLENREGIDYTVINGKEHAIIPVPLEQLPVRLPHDVDFAPKGEPPLATAKEWLAVTCPQCGGEATRDAETLDTFFDSSWYYYRYTDPKYENGPFDKLRVQELLPVDIYFGGGEHTLGHTLYARFFTKFFKDLGLVTFDEFAKKRIQHGIVLGPDGNKMSKSKGNVVNPDQVVKEYGTDSVRTYLSFMMPYEGTGPWSPDALWGIFRFLKRVWEMQDKISSSAKASTNKQVLNQDKIEMCKAIQKVGEDIADMKLNTAIAAIMKWLNYLSAKDSLSTEEYKNLLLLLAPFAPHMTEELWQSIFISDNENQSPFSSIHQEKWPSIDREILKEQAVTIVLQVNGKMRSSITFTSTLSMQEEVEKIARKDQKIQKYIADKNVKRVMYIPGKILNFVVE